jgi:hypothetical protein
MFPNINEKHNILKIKQNRQKLLASSKVNCHIKFNSKFTSKFYQFILYK